MAEQDKGSAEALRQAAADAVRTAQDVGTRIRDLTLQAFEQHRFDYTGFRQVLQSVTEGITQGAQQQGEQARAAMAAAVRGLDEAVTTAAQASRQALQQMTEQGKALTDAHVTHAVENLKQLEQDFLQNVSRAASETRGVVGEHWAAVLREAQASGTGISKVVTETSAEYSHRMAASMAEASAAGLDAARKMSEHFSEAASGFLSRVSSALRNPGGGADGKP